MVYKDVQYVWIPIALILIIHNVHNANQQTPTVFDVIKVTLVSFIVKHVQTATTLPKKANVSTPMAVLKKTVLNALIHHKNAKFVFKVSFSIHNHQNVHLVKQAIKLIKVIIFVPVNLELI